MQKQRLLVGVDVGCRKHHVTIGGPNGIVEEFEVSTIYNQALRSLGRHLTRLICSMVKNNRRYESKKEVKAA